MSTPDTDKNSKSGLFRQTFRHTAIYSGAGVLGRMISFFMLPFYAHILRDIGYGVIGMIDAGLTFLSSLVGYQFQGAVVRIYHEEEDVDRKKIVTPTGTLIVTALTGILLVLVSLVSHPLSKFLLGSADYWYLICIATAAFSIDLIGSTAQTILLIQRRSVLFSLISVSRLIVGIGMSAFLVVILRWDLLGYFVASLATSVVSTTITLVVVIRECGVGFDREIARRLLAFQLPLIPGTFASFFARQIERILVRYQIDITTLGILEMAYKFPVLLNLLLIMPYHRSWYTKQTEIAHEPDAPKLISQMFTYFLYMIVFGGLLLAVNIPTVLQLLTPQEFWPGYRPARVEILSIIILGCTVYMQFGIYYAKRTDVAARIMMGTSAIKVGLSYLMISQWGIYGAAWSGFITAGIRIIWITIKSQRFYRLHMDYRRISIIIGTAVVIFLGIDSLDTDTIASWGAPLLDQSQIFLEGLNDTWLGRWKDGKVIAILVEKSDLVLGLFVRTLLIGSYLVILPLIFPGSRRKLLIWRGFQR